MRAQLNPNESATLKRFVSGYEQHDLRRRCSVIGRCQLSVDLLDPLFVVSHSLQRLGNFKEVVAHSVVSDRGCVVSSFFRPSTFAALAIVPAPANLDLCAVSATRS